MTHALPKSITYEEFVKWYPNTDLINDRNTYPGRDVALLLIPFTGNNLIVSPSLPQLNLIGFVIKYLRSHDLYKTSIKNNTSKHCH
ncbi:MAG: hypothetical protein QNJ63_14135 [Calothrix sp. MO_192.B10]|nr:hypothetical protein [Calothrix sp. MO_192.B10]